MVDTHDKQLLDGLSEYHAGMERHLRQFQADYEILVRRWHNLSTVYEGDAATQFRKHWLRTSDYFQDYIEQLTRLIQMLEDQIQHLQEKRPADSNLT